MSLEPLKIAVIGAGAWGSALANLTARRGHETVLWSRNKHVIAAINSRHENPAYLPGITLNSGLRATAKLTDALDDASIILLVTPAQTMAQMAQAVETAADDSMVIACAKGIDRKTGLLPTETLAKVLGRAQIAALSGPSFAHDVARDLPTAVTLAAENLERARLLAELLSDNAFRVYASDDLKGVELGGALKNVIALAVGVCRGMQLGASAEAALIARGFAEMRRLATALGGRPETLMGLSGLGDLVLTCSGDQSRNFSFGLALGKGEDTTNLKLAEGAFTSEIAQKLAVQNGVDCPIISTAHRLNQRELTPREALEQLLTRPLKPEIAP